MNEAIYIDSTINTFLGREHLPMRLWCRKAGDAEVEFTMCSDNTGMPSSAISLRCTPAEAIAFLREALAELEGEANG